MIGYRKFMESRVNGDEFRFAFIFVDVMPLLKGEDGKWVKQLPIGLMTIDAHDDIEKLNLHALHDIDVIIKGADWKRVQQVADRALAAGCKRIVADDMGNENNGKNMEIIKWI